MSARLRAAGVADLPAALAINQANLPAVGPATTEKFAWFLAHAEQFTVATVDDAVVAFVITLREAGSYDSPNYRWHADRLERFLYVDRIAVDASARGQGLGRQLYDHVVAHARASAACPVVAEVNVRPRNDASLAFHAAYGFEVVAEVADPRYEDLVVAMVRFDC